MVDGRRGRPEYGSYSTVVERALKWIVPDLEFSLCDLQDAFSKDEVGRTRTRKENSTYARRAFQFLLDRGMIGKSPTRNQDKFILISREESEARRVTRIFDCIEGFKWIADTVGKIQSEDDLEKRKVIAEGMEDSWSYLRAELAETVWGVDLLFQSVLSRPPKELEYPNDPSRERLRHRVVLRTTGDYIPGKEGCLMPTTQMLMGMDMARRAKKRFNRRRWLEGPLIPDDFLLERARLLSSRRYRNLDDREIARELREFMRRVPTAKRGWTKALHDEFQKMYWGNMFILSCAKENSDLATEVD
ncbi:MAG: hypothetical protein M1144_00915 [Candidatus Thermoplasmatota archaeon]|nr:hypothetical protein [Candidatus Thermoplasmatota archaeon]MCL5984406.1 hypothetical protein [Candidatus Thermoplasmatota archaeon]